MLNIGQDNAFAEQGLAMYWAAGVQPAGPGKQSFLSMQHLEEQCAQFGAPQYKNATNKLQHVKWKTIKMI